MLTNKDNNMNVNVKFNPAAVKTATIDTNSNANNSQQQSYTAPPATPSVPVDENRKPKHLSQWTNADVIKWLRRHCEHLYEQYGDIFLAHEITGRTLCRVTDHMLERMGIELQDHRDELRRIIMKLKLKSDMVKLKDLERT